MMGPRQVEQGALFLQLFARRALPADHLLRFVDRFVDLAGLRRELAPFYSQTGRPSVDPELMIRMLIVGYCFGIRSGRRLCDEVHLNLAYRSQNDGMRWVFPVLAVRLFVCALQRYGIWLLLLEKVKMKTT